MNVKHNPETDDTWPASIFSENEKWVWGVVLRETKHTMGPLDDKELDDGIQLVLAKIIYMVRVM